MAFLGSQEALRHCTLLSRPKIRSFSIGAPWCRRCSSPSVSSHWSLGFACGLWGSRSCVAAVTPPPPLQCLLLFLVFLRSHFDEGGSSAVFHLLWITKMRRDASSLAIVEKRARQRGTDGIVGVLFQFLEWNRRLAKKKLLLNKLLPPVRAAKRASKKFGTDERMPTAKLLLIAEENRGGFPNSKNQEAGSFYWSASDDLGNGDGMCTPGVVARLMGLDSIPAGKPEEPRKALDTRFYYDMEAAELPRRLDQDLCSDTGRRRRLEPRPQKLQKNGGGFPEQRPGNDKKFGSDVVRFNKGVVPRMKKHHHHHHHKLASPVKSPRMPSRKSSVRLMEAATKILEPGLRTRSLAKCALTHTTSSQGCRDKANDVLPMKRAEKPSDDSLFVPCTSRCSLIEDNKYRLNVGNLLSENESFALDLSNISSAQNGFEETRMGVPDTPVDQKSASSLHAQPNIDVQGNPVKLTGEKRKKSFAIQAKINVQDRARDSKERNHHGECKPQKDVASRSALRQNILRQNQLPLVKDKVVAPMSKVCSRENSQRNLNGCNGAKNFVALNQNLNTCKHERSITKVLGNCTVQAEKNDLEKKNITCKRRPINSPKIKNASVAGFTSAKQSSLAGNMMHGEGVHLINNCSVGHEHVNSEFRELVEGNGAIGSRGGNIVSFTFTSPMRHDPRSSSSKAMAEKRRSLGRFSHDAFHKRMLMNEKKVCINSCPRGIALSGDALSSLLQEKIRELISLDQDNVTTGNASPEKFAGPIFEELISGLKMGVSIQKKSGDGFLDASSPIDDLYSCCANPAEFTVLHDQEHNINLHFQAEGRAGISAMFPTSNSTKSIPVSILEDSFSDASGPSWSPTGCSGYKLRFEPTESFHNKLQPLDLNNELLDAATSSDNQKRSVQRNISVIDQVSTMHDISFNEATSHAQLLLENVALYESDGVVDSSLGLFLCDMLQAITNFSCPHLARTSGVSWVKESWVKEGNKLRSLLFDTTIEYLDSKFTVLCKSALNAWSKHLLFLARDKFIQEIFEEIQGWNDLAARTLDEMIEKDMSRSTREWTEFEIEELEMGMELGNGILQVLVDEMFIDLSNQ